MISKERGGGGGVRSRRYLTSLCNLLTVSMLWANTSSPDWARLATASMSPRKSGARHSTSMEGFSSLIRRTVLAKCSEPPSGRSSLRGQGRGRRQRRGRRELFSLSLSSSPVDACEHDITHSPLRDGCGRVLDLVLVQRRRGLRGVNGAEPAPPRTSVSH